MADVVLRGNITKIDEITPFDRSTLRKFTVAEEVIDWNKESRQKEIKSQFWYVEEWVPGVLRDDDQLYVGDAVLVVGRLVQSRSSGGASHTRISVDTLAITRRGKQWQDAQGLVSTSTYTPPAASAIRGTSSSSLIHHTKGLASAVRRLEIWYR